MNANKSHLLLSVLFIAIVGSLINLFVKIFPLTFAKAIYFCQRSFANAITFPHTTPFFILLFLSFVFIVGFFVIAGQVLQTQRFIKKVVKRTIALPKKLQFVAQKAGLTNKIVVIEDRKHFAFCYGLLRRKLCLSTGLMQGLTKSELKAVLLHEKYHLKNFDPLRILLGKTASRMLFFIPILQDIQTHYVLSKEIAADDEVVRSGNKESLISALTKTLSFNTPAFYGIAAFTDGQDLEKRILHLLNEKKRIAINLSKRNLFFSLGILSLLFVTLSMPIHAVAMTNKSMDIISTVYICPFGESCLSACKQEMKEQKSFDQENGINASSNLLYTPVGNK